jgi:hypothetical protein
VSRVVLTANVTVPGTGGGPARVYRAGHVLELSAAEQTAVTTAGGTLRATVYRDQLGEATAVSNSD